LDSGTFRTTSSRHAAIAAQALMFAMLAINAAFVGWVLDGQFSSHQPHFLGWYSVMILIGLHLDQLHGIFFQNPVLFGGLVGLPLLVRLKPRFSLMWALVYVALLAPVAAYGIGYGGWSPAGRYQWDLAPLWIFPLAAFLGWVLRQRGGRTVWATVLGLAVLLQAAFAARWVRVYEFLISPVIADTKSPMLWAQNSLYGRLRQLLPHFAVPAEVFAWGPNTIWLLLAVLCIAFGAALCGAFGMRMRRPLRSTLIGAGSVAAVAAALLLAWPVKDEAIVLRGADLRGLIGHITPNGRRATQRFDASGYMVVGPSLALDAGCYRVTLAYEAHTPRAAPPYWEMRTFHPYPGTPMVIDGAKLLSAGSHEMRREFGIPPGSHWEGFQFLVGFAGAGVVDVNGITIERTATCG
jgi:hypothetical protein